MKEVTIMSAITLWRPNRNLAALSDTADRFFDDWFYRPSRLWVVPAWSEVLPVDVYREDGNLVIKAEVPGVSSDDLEITVKDQVLTISGETRAEEEVEEENYIRRERRYGSFCRSVALPAEAEGEKAEAVFEDGVLIVTVPVAQEPQPETVKIEVKES
jgi:HSP20 family protein